MSFSIDHTRALVGPSDQALALQVFDEYVRKGLVPLARTLAHLHNSVVCT